MRESGGFALTWALFLVVLVGALGAALVERDQTVRRDGLRDLERLRAFQAAEGGLERARHALRGDPAWAGGSFALGPTTVRVEVERRAEEGWQVRTRAEPGAVRIEALLEAARGLPRIRLWRELP